MEAGRRAWDVELGAVEPAAATVACSLVVVEVQDQLVVAVAMAAALLLMAEVAAEPQTHLNWIKKRLFIAMYHNQEKYAINYLVVYKRKTEISQYKYYLALKVVAVATDIQRLMWEVDYLEVAVVVLKEMAEEHLLDINTMYIFH